MLDIKSTVLAFVAVTFKYEVELVSSDGIVTTVGIGQIKVSEDLG